MASKRSVAGAISRIERYQILKPCFLQNTQMYISVPGPGLRNRHSDPSRAERFGVWVPVGARDILHTRLDRPWNPPSLLYNGYRGHSPGINNRGMTLTNHPYIAPLCACIPCYGATLTCPRKIPGSVPCFAVFECTTSNHSRRTVSVRPCCRSLAALIVLKRVTDLKPVMPLETAWTLTGRSLSSVFTADFPNSWYSLPLSVKLVGHFRELSLGPTLTAKGKTHVLYGEAPAYLLKCRNARFCLGTFLNVPIAVNFKLAQCMRWMCIGEWRYSCTGSWHRS